MKWAGKKKSVPGAVGTGLEYAILRPGEEAELAPLGPVPYMSMEEMWRKGYLVDLLFRPDQNDAPLRKTMELRHGIFGRTGSRAQSESARLSALLRQDYAPPEPAVPDYPPARGFGYRIPILPEDEARRRQMTQLFGQPQTPEEKEAALMKSLVSKALAERDVATAASAATNVNQPNDAKAVTSPEQTHSSDAAPTTVGQQERGRRATTSGTSDPGPPTQKPVDEKSMLHALQFDPNGPTRSEVLRDIPQAYPVMIYAGIAASFAASRQFPNLSQLHNNAGDAFRHAIWSYKLARSLGPENAKRVTDAYEISEPNPRDERLMDVFNNNVGRRLAMDPRNHGRDDADVVQEALKRGKLQLNKFKIVPGSEVSNRKLPQSDYSP